MKVSLSIALALATAYAGSAYAQSLDTVAPNELAQAFRDNPIAAKRRFNGAPFAVAGLVSSITEGKGSTGRINFIKTGDDFYMVTAVVPEEEVLTLTRGQFVRVKCSQTKRSTAGAPAMLLTLEPCHLASY
jgi:hypothetical protein